jgi:hypothetical protein
MNNRYTLILSRAFLTATIIAMVLVIGSLVIELSERQIVIGTMGAFVGAGLAELARAIRERNL